MLRALPAGTLLVVINTIDLLLLLISKVISLENFWSVSYFECVCSHYFVPILLSLSLSLSVSPSRTLPSRVLAVICNFCLYGCGVSEHPLAVMKPLTSRAFCADGFHSGLVLLY